MWKITFIVLFNVLSFPRTIYNVLSPNLSGTKHKTSHNKCDNVSVAVNVNVISGDMDLHFTLDCSKYIRPSSQQDQSLVDIIHFLFVTLEYD